MQTFDFTPLYRSSVGFDRLARLLDANARPGTPSSNGFPPYNIAAIGEDHYRITMAVAGFTDAELSVEAKEHVLTIKGEKTDEDSDKEILYRGIASRTFERRFQIAEHVRVDGASLENGLLHVDLVREIPEAMKPRKIEISSGASKQIEAKTH